MKPSMSVSNSIYLSRALMRQSRSISYMSGVASRHFSLLRSLALITACCTAQQTGMHDWILLEAVDANTVASERN